MEHDLEIRAFTHEDIPMMRKIWNSVVEEGNAFPQEEPLSGEDALPFFSSQSYSGVAVLDGRTAGLYILHPNNVGRCGHIANCSYAVGREYRGMHIGERLVMDSLSKGQDVRILDNAIKFSRSLRLLSEAKGGEEWRRNDWVCI